MHRAALVPTLVLALLLPTVGGAGPAPSQPIRLIAIGDFGVGGTSERSFGAAVRRFEASNPADALVSLGDSDYSGSPTTFHQNWRASFGWLAHARVDVAGVLGNHDVRVERGRYEYDELHMPNRYYRRVVGPVEVYLLDSNAIDPAQTAWLRRSLSRSTARWRIAVHHHPAFTCGSYFSNPDVVAQWVPLFERYRVQLVLSGHDHNYQRFAARRGVRYIIHGGGGTRQYDLADCPAGYPRRLAARQEQGFLYLVIRGARVDGFAVDSAGRRTDHFAFTG